jgi:predicted nucleotidyltransferase
MIFSTRESTVSAIREDVLRDPRYPVHKIADRLLPYLRVLVERFHPQEVILFGSYAYGEPDVDSDVDLLIVKPINRSRLQDKLSIRSAWWPLLISSSPLSFDLLLADPEEHAQRRQRGSAYYKEITERGLRLA